MFKNFIKILFIASFLSGCLSPKAPTTCSELSKDYHQYDDVKEKIVLDVAKNYRSLAEYMFSYDKTTMFNENVDTYFLYLELLKKKSIDNPFLNQYCNNINFTIKNNDTTRVSEDLKIIKKEWTNDYNENIANNIENNIIFNEIEGCKEHADTLVNYILKYQVTGKDKGSNKIYFKMKDMYDECLSIHKNKK